MNTKLPVGLTPHADPAFAAALAKLTKLISRRATLADHLLEAEANGAAPRRVALLRNEYRLAVAAARRGVRIKHSTKILQAA